MPLFVVDAGYDPVPLTEGLAATRAAILVRLRRDRCFSADPTTWPPLGDDLSAEDGRYGTVRVRAWAELPPSSRCMPAGGAARPGRWCAARWCSSR